MFTETVHDLDDARRLCRRNIDPSVYVVSLVI